MVYVARVLLTMDHGWSTSLGCCGRASRHEREPSPLAPKAGVSTGVSQARPPPAWSGLAARPTRVSGYIHALAVKASSGPPPKLRR